LGGPTPASKKSKTKQAKTKIKNETTKTY